MPRVGEDGGSPRSPSDSSEDSDSQDSESMPRGSATAGKPRPPKSGVAKKQSCDPHREKRKKAKRACRPCQIAHLTCSKSVILHCPLPASRHYIVIAEYIQVMIVHARDAQYAIVSLNAKMECERKQSI